MRCVSKVIGGWPWPAPYGGRRRNPPLILKSLLALILVLFPLSNFVPQPLAYAHTAGHRWGPEDNPPPQQTYYLTLPEADGLAVLNAIHTDADAPMYTYFSIAIAMDGTYVYYDQWEDGYAADLANPTPAEIYNGATNPAGVQIWGNGEADDGCAPNIAGVPVTCTDADDVLNAGDVIIPYNSVDVPRVPTAQTYVLDQFGAVAYNNQNGNANWSTDWVETGDYATENYRDQFGTAAYNNSNGTLDWSGSYWTEVGDDGSPTGGYTLITGGVLRFSRYSAQGDAIWRIANLSGYTNATLSFTLDGNRIDGANDAIAVDISGDGGSSWTRLQTFTTDPNGATFTYDVTGYMASNTAVRFMMVGNDLVDYNERWDIDNVDFAIQEDGVTSPSGGDIGVAGGALRLTATEADDSIYRGVNLSAADDCTALRLTLGQNGIDADEDRLAVEISGDGGTNYTTLETFDASGDAGAKSYPIPAAYRTADLRVRFRSVDALETGEYWTFDDVRVEWNCALPIRFDAGDKVGASNVIAMARAIWASGSGTLNAFAHEMYPVNEWGTVYESPVSSNTGADGDPSRYQFEYSALTIMASQDGTVVQIDANADGTYESSVTLDEGEATLATGILQGARVEADKPVQVVLLTGDINDSYESRDMAMLPVSAWGSSYWSPVGVMWNANPTRLYLYNLSTNGSIYITCERYGAANTTLGPVAARGVVTLDLGPNQGAHCYASDSGGTATSDLIFGIGTIDTAAGDGGGDDGSRSDWSFTMFPDTFLTTEALVGLGLGKDPTDTSSTENGSPLWVAAACDTGGTYVYVDWDNDGAPDGIDTDGDDVAESGSENGLLVERLQSVRLFEPGADEEEYDQSAARVWSRTESGVGYGGIAGCRLAVSWGQDPNNATAGTPGLDVGTSVSPLRLVEATKTLVLLSDNDGDGLLSPGDTAIYNMTVRNSGPALVQNVYIYDNVPANMSYVEDTTEYNMTGVEPWTSIPDDTSGTPYPLDVPGGVLLGDLDPGETYYIRFQVLLEPDYQYATVENCDVAYTGGGNLSRCATNLVASYDWGDLPESYGTTTLGNGPHHSPSALRLGAWFDRELEGQPLTSAEGDDNAETTLPHGNDEDGASNAATPLQWAGGSGAFGVTVSGGPGCLNAWMDFTDDAGQYPVDPAYGYYADGDFTKNGGHDTVTIGAATYSEHMIQNVLLGSGTTNVPVSVPPNLNYAEMTSFYFRFRLSPPSGTGTPEDPYTCTTAIAPTGFVEGGEVEDYLFDLGTPTAVKLISFTATGGPGHVLVAWETATEADNLGFNLYRRQFGTEAYSQLNPAFIPALEPGQTQGHRYSFRDETVAAGTTYEYLLEDVDSSGVRTAYGPVRVTALYAIYLPLARR